MSEQELKKHIRNWIKNNAVASDLGEISVGTFLGEGGNALVYSSPFAGGTAIKFLAESVSSQPTSRYMRFLNEYRNLIKLVPTGAVVPLYQFGIQEMNGERIPFIVMEQCIKTLHDAYKSTKIANITDFTNLLKRLLHILEIMHNANIVHRDIKPRNILLRSNNEWVLGDFGIAWFDPNIYEKLVATDKNERLANYEFSAPEQIRRGAYERALPCMDYYALGQTLYYLVTGQTIRGLDYQSLEQVVPDLKIYDPLIKGLVKQVPSERFQSVNEIYEFLAEQKNQRDRNRDIYYRQNMVDNFYRNLATFDNALRRAIPGQLGYIQAKNKEEIDRVMSSLSECCKECQLWWFGDLSNNPVETLEELPGSIWLIDGHECDIADMWLYRSLQTTHQYVVIQLAPRPQFDVVDHAFTETHELAGIYADKYITYGEYHDGYAVIDGKVVEVLEGKHRRRNMKTDFLFLAPKASTINWTKDALVHSVYEKLIANGKFEKSILESCSNFERPEWIEWDLHR